MIYRAVLISIAATTLASCAASPESVEQRLQEQARDAVAPLMAQYRPTFGAAVGNLSETGEVSICGAAAGNAGQLTYVVTFAGGEPQATVLDNFSSDASWADYKARCNTPAFERFSAAKQADAAQLLARAQS